MTKLDHFFVSDTYKCLSLKIKLTWNDLWIPKMNFWYIQIFYFSIIDRLFVLLKISSKNCFTFLNSNSNMENWRVWWNKMKVHRYFHEIFLFRLIEVIYFSLVTFTFENESSFFTKRWCLNRGIFRYYHWLKLKECQRIVNFF